MPKVEIAVFRVHSPFLGFSGGDEIEFFCVITMKLLMFDTNDFWYKIFSKTVDSAEICDMEESTINSLVIFINVEKEDEVQKDKVVKKAINNISWLAKKTDRKKVALRHSLWIR